MKRRRSLWLALLLCLLVGCDGGGDRVLVAKSLYDSGFMPPRRYDVVVFKFPDRPIEDGTPKNYIKRLLGLPGELVALFFGRIYRYDSDKHGPIQHDDKHVNELDLWRKKPAPGKGDDQFGVHENHERDRDLFEKGKFEILRKPPQVMLAMRRPVYDNDHPAKDLLAAGFPDRWQAVDKSWVADQSHGFKLAGADAEEHWLKYQHILRPHDWPNAADGEEALKRKMDEIKQQPPRPQVIKDFLGYNIMPPNGDNWVGDLMIECELNVAKAQGEFVLDLAKGMDRFQARIDLTTGQCSLYRKEGEDAWKLLDGGQAATKVKAAGNYQLRFANIDERLTLWVDRDLPFGDGCNYSPPKNYGSVDKNDLEPVKLGGKNAAVSVHHLKLWRDTYYTIPGARTPSDYLTIYVQPKHYLCLGDNSAHSSDGREWGLVPDRLMLGRALVVYYPLNRLGTIK